MDGIEFCRQSQARATPLPLVVFIHSGLLEDLGRAVSVGVEYVLYKDAMRQPDQWAHRCGEILDGLSGRLPSWLLRCQHNPPEAEASLTRDAEPVKVLTGTSTPGVPGAGPFLALSQALEQGLGGQRYAALGSLLLTRVWRQVFGTPPDLAHELTSRQTIALAVGLAVGVWRLLGTDESRNLRIALEPILPGVSGAERIP
jgi:hypothetical protein